MAKTILAALIGGLLGFAASRIALAAGGTPCGSQVCTASQTCCFIAIHPFHYRCVNGNTCPDF